MSQAPHVAIIGGGFSGAMLAARLAEQGVASCLIDRSGCFGTGVAYSTRLDAHVLNVRAGRMSAVEDRPDDFTRWLAVHHPGHANPDGFAPRRLYGLYLEHRLISVEVTCPGLITRVAGDADAVEHRAVRLTDGRRIEADAVVIATGNPAPKTADPARAGESDRLIGDPWAPDAMHGIGPEDDVLVLGTGLTMVDVVLGLQARGWRGRAIALSRRGLIPRAHGAGHDAPITPGETLTSGPMSRRLAEGRRQAAADGWRGVMEGLRPMTATLWVDADDAARSRFLRHLRPWWDVHRHRIAAEIAAAVDTLKAEGRLVVVAGRVRRIQDSPAGVTIDWTPRGASEAAPLIGHWLIDCTGPGHDPAIDPLTGPLLASGRARPGPMGLGLDLDADGRVLGANGVADSGLFVLGPPARAAFWETVAVPDIRKRIERLVQTLAAH